MAGGNKFGLSKLAKNAVKRVGGQTPMRFMFLLRPTCIESIPGNAEHIVLLWQGGGSKLQYTKVHPVASGKAMFETGTQLRQTTTLYTKGDQYEPKEYIFKLQIVQSSKGVDKTSTIAKFKLDFTTFCKLSSSNAEEEIEVWLKGPGGVKCLLHAYVSAVFLKNVETSGDTQSEISFMTQSETPRSYNDESLSEMSDSGEHLPFEYPEFPDCVPSFQGEEPATPSKDAASEVASPELATSPPEKQPAQAAQPASNCRKANHSHSASAAAVQAAVGAAVDLPLRASSAGQDMSLSTISEQDYQALPRSASDQHPASQDAPTPTKSWTKSLFSRKQQPRPKVSEPVVISEAMMRQAASQREVVDLQAEEDVDHLRRRAVRLLRDRDMLREQVHELRTMLRATQAEVQTDQGITQALVATKLELADAEYEKLKWKLAFQIEQNRSRVLRSRFTSLTVDVDLLRNKDLR